MSEQCYGSCEDGTGEKGGARLSKLTLERSVVTIRDGIGANVVDMVIREEIFKITVNSVPFVTMACLPENLEDLALGLLRSEGALTDMKEVSCVTVDHTEKWIDVKGEIAPHLLERSATRRFLASGCGIVACGGTFEWIGEDCMKVKSDYTVHAGLISKLMHKVSVGGFLFKATGATHTVALAIDGKIACICEDISRHSAVDKAIGRALREGWDTSRGILLSSGRLSVEIVQKGVAAKVPLIVSRTAPMQLAIEAAHRLLVTLVGFTRGRRMNIYTHPWRIKGFAQR